MMVRMRLQVARIESGLSQKDLGAEVGVSQQTIAKWELGLTTPSHFTQMRALESVLGHNAAHLFPDVFDSYELAE